MDAVQIVAERAGIPLAVETAGNDRPRQSHPHQALYDIHTEAAKFYHAVLMTTKMGEEARAYLYQRGLTDDVLKHFQIGLAPNEGNYLHKSMAGKFDENTIMNSGLFNLAENNLVYDAFQNRIMFPLTNDAGRLWPFPGGFGKKRLQTAIRPSIKIVAAPLFSIKATSSIIWIRPSRLSRRAMRFI